MKYKINKNKKEMIKIMLDGLNKSNIFKEEIPKLKIHNCVLTKTTEPQKVYLNQKDLEEYQINPKKVSNRLKKLEEGYTYEQKETVFENYFNFNDEINIKADAQVIARQVKDLIIDKMNNIPNFPYTYDFTVWDEENKATIERKYNSEGTLLYAHEHSYYDNIYIYVHPVKKEHDLETKYFGIKTIISITVNDDIEKIYYSNELKVQLHIDLKEILAIRINIERDEL